jgi:hypothetical protein
LNLSIRRLTRAALVLLITGTCVWPANSASLRCRSDPAVLLSDGTLLDLSADVDAMLWDITSVEYIIHVPATTKALAVIPTPNWPGTLEKIVVLSDMPARTYDTQTTIRTRQATTAVRANLLVKPLLQVLPSLKSVDGVQAKPIRVTIVTKGGLRLF